MRWVNGRLRAARRKSNVPMELESLVHDIQDFEQWNHVKKIKFFTWFLHSLKQMERVNAVDVKRCYDTLHLPPTNINKLLSDLTKKQPKEAIKDSRGYYLVKGVRDTFESKYGQKAVEHTPKTEQVLPVALVKATRRNYLEKIILQANGCYERGWYDGCAVMMRRFIETMIIEVYEAHGKASEIKDSSGHFIMLRDLLTKFLNDTTWNLQRETQRLLPEVKALGDSSAHARRFIAIKEDVDKLLQNGRYRVAAEDLIHLAKLK